MIQKMAGKTPAWIALMVFVILGGVAIVPDSAHAQVVPDPPAQLTGFTSFIGSKDQQLDPSLRDETVNGCLVNRPIGFEAKVHLNNASNFPKEYRIEWHVFRVLPEEEYELVRTRNTESIVVPAQTAKNHQWTQDNCGPYLKRSGQTMKIIAVLQIRTAGKGAWVPVDDGKTASYNYDHLPKDEEDDPGAPLPGGGP